VRSQRSQRKSHEDLLACVREMRRLHNDRDGIEGEYSGMKQFQRTVRERDAQNYYARV
jgi:hypothetical protein